MKGHIISLIIKDITINKMGSEKSLIYIVISADLGIRVCNFESSPKF